MNMETKIDMIDVIADRVMDRIRAAPELQDILALIRPAPEDESLWDAKQVMAHLGCSEGTLYKYQKRPGFPTDVGKGRKRKWLAADIRAWERGTYGKGRG